MRLYSRLFLILVAVSVVGVFSCKKDIVHHDMPGEDQRLAGRLYGTWAVPSTMVTPDNVPHDIFGNMRLVFTVDENGNPAKFFAQNCPIVFGNEGSGTWSISGTDEQAKVNLIGVEPVDDFDVKISSFTLTISFYMGWENTDTQEKGQGDFRVTLTRQ